MAIIRDVAGGVGPDAAHRSLPRAVDRPCSRPSCTTPAAATLTFRYGTREAWIERLADRVDPQSYDLCVTHAARTHPPEGWQLRDRRPEGERRPAEPHPTPVDLGGDRTVAVLAAALRSVPDPVSEDAVADPTEVDRAVATVAATAGATVAPTADVEPTTHDPDPAGELVLELAEATSPPAEPPTVPRPPLAVRDRATSDGTRELAADW